MNFVRQFESVKTKKVKKTRRKSATVQGAVLSNQKIVEKYLSGNSFGLSFNANVTYDSDDPDFDFARPVFIDRSDRILSLHSLKQRSVYLDNKIRIEKERLEAEKAKSLAASSPT